VAESYERRYWIFGLYETRGISLLIVWLLVSREGLPFRGVSYRTKKDQSLASDSQEFLIFFSVVSSLFRNSQGDHFQNPQTPEEMFASRLPSCIITAHTSEPLHYEQANDLTPFLAYLYRQARCLGHRVQNSWATEFKVHGRQSSMYMGDRVQSSWASVFLVRGRESW
jgi:hypothetical protein